MGLRVPLIAYVAGHHTATRPANPRYKIDSENIASVSAALKVVQSRSHKLMSPENDIIGRDRIVNDIVIYPENGVIYETNLEYRPKLTALTEMFPEFTLVVPDINTICPSVDHQPTRRIWDHLGNRFRYQIINVSNVYAPFNETSFLELGIEIFDFCIYSTEETESDIKSWYRGIEGHKRKQPRTGKR